MPFISGASDLVGLIQGISGQNAEKSALNATGNAFTGAVGQTQGEGSALYGNYANNAQPAMNSIIANAPGQIAGYQGGAAGLYGQEGAYGQQLGASPYPGMIQSAGGQFMTYPTGTIGSEISNAQALQNWQGLKPKELGEATTVASDAALSAANTMKAQMGGVANPGAVMASLGNQAAKAGMETGAQLGAMAQEQELGAREAAGQELATAAGQQLEQVAGQVGATEAAGQQYASDLTGAGGLVGQAGSGLAGLAGQDIGLLENSLNTEAGMAQTGIGAQENAASLYEQLMGSEMGMLQGQGNPFTNFATNLMSLFGGFGGGGGQIGGSGFQSAYNAALGGAGGAYLPGVGAGLGVTS
jgi:hypothetical protein